MDRFSQNWLESTGDGDAGQTKILNTYAADKARMIEVFSELSYLEVLINGWIQEAEERSKIEMNLQGGGILEYSNILYFREGTSDKDIISKILSEAESTQRDFWDIVEQDYKDHFLAQVTYSPHTDSKLPIPPVFITLMSVASSVRAGNTAYIKEALADVAPPPEGPILG
jgi:hypothetical protein